MSDIKKDDHPQKLDANNFKNKRPEVAKKIIWDDKEFLTTHQEDNEEPFENDGAYADDDLD
jgi:hypothetical protein